MTNDLIAELPEQLEPLRQLAEKMLVEGSHATPQGIAIGHRPSVAPEYHAMFAFAGVSLENVLQYETRFRLTIPASYKTQLTYINGFHAFELSLFGIPASMMLGSPCLDRTQVGPLDISIANQDWKRGYQVSPQLFHFGSGPLSVNEHVGYFLRPNSEGIYAYRRNGELFNSWGSMRDFLADELRRAEGEFGKYEVLMRDVQGTELNPERTSIIRRIFDGRVSRKPRK